jgi:cytochrome c553
MVCIAWLLAFPFTSWGQTDRPVNPLSQTRGPPDWLFPVNPPDRGEPAAEDDDKDVRVPGSGITFRSSELDDLFSTPDWHPNDHPAMPDVVAHGRQPDVYACGYCHLPDGSGRPENASLAGLPAAYIVQQVANFKNGVRRTAIPSRIPPKLMTELAAVATDAEINAAAEYFSQLQPQFHIKVIETATVPPSYVASWILALDKKGRRQPIGERIIEVPDDVEQFEHRDARASFLAYVPVGAVKAGKVLVVRGGPDKTVACNFCHGTDLKGSGAIPGIAGRSPSYIMRQLYDIQSGLRAGAGIAPMVEVVKRLSMAEMIDVSAYLATLR